MGNHVHLLVSVDDAAQLAGMMKGVGQRYAQYVNYRHGASATGAMPKGGMMRW
jgi:putative transposase